MTGFVLDTDVLSEFSRRGEPDARVKRWLTEFEAGSSARFVGAAENLPAISVLYTAVGERERIILMETDELNTLVTEAIWRAEELEAGDIAARQAWAEVSSIEEKLANALPASEPQGRIARRGAVQAALKAGDDVRAHALAASYLADEAAPESLRAALREILEQGSQAAEHS